MVGAYIGKPPGKIAKKPGEYKMKDISTSKAQILEQLNRRGYDQFIRKAKLKVNGTFSEESRNILKNGKVTKVSNGDSRNLESRQNGEGKFEIKQLQFFKFK